jgi:hypothetical protein
VGGGKWRRVKTPEELVEISIRNAQENPQDLARWLACEVLLSDEAALGDDELVNRLIGLQDRLSDLTRVRYGIPAGKIPPSRARQSPDPTAIVLRAAGSGP